jgi:biotin transport system substrate-specific component
MLSQTGFTHIFHKDNGMNESKGIHASTKDLASQAVITRALWIVAFTALTVIGAQIEIPHLPVPYTMQTLIVLLAGAILGKKDGAISQAAYLLAGIAGLPVFAQFGFGFAKIIGPTGGYLLAFPIAAYVIGMIVEERRTFLRCLVAMTTGLFIIFSLGTLQLNFVLIHNLRDSIGGGFLIFSFWDLAKLLTAAGIASRFSRKL